MAVDRKQETTKRVHEIIRKSKELGVPERYFRQLHSFQRFEKLCYENRLRSWLAFVLGVITAVLFTVFFQQQLHTLEGFSRFWLKWEGLDIYDEHCTVEVPGWIRDIFHPPMDCRVCTDLQQVEKVDDISPEIFEKRYAYSGRPVVVVDGMRDWTATDIFSFDFFKNVYEANSRVFDNHQPGCQFFTYKSGFSNLSEVFNMSQERANLKKGSEPWYIGWSNCDTSAAGVLRKHYRRPYFLPPSAESSSTDWIFMGSPGFGADMHIDSVMHPSWQAQVTGKKLWTLEPPPECYNECRVLEVEVSPGEIIVLDTNIWYHKTLITSNSISITIGSEFD